MTQPIPPGHPTVAPYLICRRASEAIAFYQRAFGAELRERLPESGAAVMHARLQLGDAFVYLTDEVEGRGVRSPLHYGGSPVAVLRYVTDCDAAFARASAAGVTALATPRDTFWGDRWGMLADPFGHVWQLATRQEDVPLAEMRRRSAAQQRDAQGST